MDIELGHTAKGVYCIACGSLCKWHGERLPRRRNILRRPAKIARPRPITAVYSPPAESGYTRDEMALLRERFQDWKQEHGITGSTALVDVPAFADGIRSLIVEHDYSCTDVGFMLGVSRERVRQWAVRLRITERGDNHRLWDDTANRFVTVGDGYKKEYVKAMTNGRKRGQVRRFGTTWGDITAKRRRIAMWVLRDLGEGGDAPSLADLLEAFGFDTRRTSLFLGRIGIGNASRRKGVGVRVGLDELWREAGYADRPKWARYRRATQIVSTHSRPAAEVLASAR